MGRIDDARDMGHLLLDEGEGWLAGTIKPEHEVDLDASRFAHALDDEARLVFCVLRVARRVDALHKACALGNRLDEYTCLVDMPRSPDQHTASRLQPNLATGGLVLPKRAPAPGTRAV